MAGGALPENEGSLASSGDLYKQLPEVEDILLRRMQIANESSAYAMRRAARADDAAARAVRLDAHEMVLQAQED
jgi:hypothetical protein